MRNWKNISGIGMYESSFGKSEKHISIFTHSKICYRLQRTNKEGTSSRERTAVFGLIMPGGPPPAFPADHTVLPSIASQTSTRKFI